MEYLDKNHEQRFYKLMAEDNKDYYDKERQILLSIPEQNQRLIRMQLENQLHFIIFWILLIFGFGIKKL